jgi:hypothetical protein
MINKYNFEGIFTLKWAGRIIKIHHSKTNKWDATVDALQVRKRIKHLTSENCKRDKRNYTKSTNEYWSDIIFKQRADHFQNICQLRVTFPHKF